MAWMETRGWGGKNTRACLMYLDAKWLGMYDLGVGFGGCKGRDLVNTHGNV